MLADSLRREKLLLLRTWRLPDFLKPREGVKLKDAAEFNTVLGQLLTRGVPLVEALQVTAESVSAGARPLVERMRELVAAGSSFSDASLRVGFSDAVSAAVYRAAERSGDLGGAASQLAASARRQLAVAGRAATLMIYPAIVLTISIIICIGMLIFIVPRIGEALQEAGADMPWFSKLVIDLGEFMRVNLLWMLIGLLVLSIAIVAVRARVLSMVWTAARRLPYMSDLIMAQEITRFFSVLAAMTRSGVPLADALAVANGAVGHPTLSAQLTTLQTKLVEGGSLPYLVDTVSALPLATRKLLVAAERSGDLEPAFASLASDMSDEVDRRSQRLLAVLQPGLVIVMAGMIGTLILSLMIPLLTLAGGDFQ